MIQRAAVNKDLFALGDDHHAFQNADNSRLTTSSSISDIGDGDAHMNPSSDRPPMTSRSNSFSLPPSIHATAPAVAEDNLYKDNVQRRIDPLSDLSTSQSPILTPHDCSLNTSGTETASTTQPSIKLSKLNSRLVRRLSQLKNRNIVSIKDNPSSGIARPRSALSTSRRFLATKPRYTCYYE
jgi:hypothetical protein